MRLDGKHAPMTEAHSGIGRAIAKVFSCEGAAVVVDCREEGPRSEAVTGEIRALGHGAIACAADLSFSEAADDLFTASAVLGLVDVAVNTAGTLESYPSARQGYGDRRGVGYLAGTTLFVNGGLLQKSGGP